jgi:hypothetical protein
VFAAGAFAAGAFTFGVARGVGGGDGCVTGGFTDGSSVFAGAAGGGAGGFTAAASSVFSGVAGGGTGAVSGVDTAAGGGFSVPREHALSPNTTATIKQILVDHISVTPSQQRYGCRPPSGPHEPLNGGPHSTPPHNSPMQKQGEPVHQAVRRHFSTKE